MSTQASKNTPDGPASGGTHEPTFRVAARIDRPIDDVFEAVVDPTRLSNYFTTGGAEGRLETGAVVTWAFHDFPGSFPVRVDRVDAEGPKRRIVLRWDADDTDAPEPYLTEATLTFVALDDGRTLVEVSETGWRQTPSGRRASYGNCSGWMQMLCSLKAWLEHGINLREGMFA